MIGMAAVGVYFLVGSGFTSIIANEANSSGDQVRSFFLGAFFSAIWPIALFAILWSFAFD
jgi:hypothetical protein